MEFNFDGLTELVANTKISHQPVKFPLTHLGAGKFVFGASDFPSTDEFTLSQLGAGYLSERLKQYKYAFFTKLVRDGEWDKITEVCQQHPQQLAGDYVAAFYEGQLVGVMSNYSPVRHDILLGMIDFVGMKNNVVGYWMTQTELVIDLRVTAIEERETQTRLRIRNGHSGHFALSYNGYLNIEGYEWEERLRVSRRRHLSKVNLAVSALSDALEEMSELKIVDQLMHVSGAKAIDLMRGDGKYTVRQEQVINIAVDVLRGSPSLSAMGLMTTIGGYSQTLGYKSAVQGLMDKVVEYAVELLK